MQWKSNGPRFLALLVFSLFPASAGYGNTIHSGGVGCRQKCRLSSDTAIQRPCINRRSTECTTSWQFRFSVHSHHQTTPLITSPSTMATLKGNAQTTALKISDGQLARSSVRTRTDQPAELIREDPQTTQSQPTRSFERSKEFWSLNMDGLAIGTASHTRRFRTKAWNTPLSAPRDCHYMFSLLKHSRKSPALQVKAKQPSITSIVTKLTTGPTISDGHQCLSNRETQQDSMAHKSLTTSKLQLKSVLLAKTRGSVTRRVQTRLATSKCSTADTLRHSQWHSSSKNIHLEQQYASDRTLDGALDVQSIEVTLTAHHHIQQTQN